MSSRLSGRLRRLEKTVPPQPDVREWHLDDILRDFALLERYFGKSLEQITVADVMTAPDAAFRGLQLYNRPLLAWLQGEGRLWRETERKHRAAESVQSCAAKAAEFERAGYASAALYYRGLVDSARREAAW